VMVNFMKSGNHDSSFTRAALISLKKAQGDTSLLTSSLAGNNDDSDANFDDGDDEFGMESGGWCNFTNSLPIINLRMWLNEKPNLFVARLQKKERRAILLVLVLKNNKQRKSPSETTAEAIAGLVKVKELELSQP
jgi:hypothetical protein